MNCGLQAYTTENGLEYVIPILDVGSGMNFQKKGFIKLLGLLFKGEVSKIIVTHKDRLMRFGFALIEKICEYLNVEIEVLSPTATPDFASQLTADLVEIITVFSAKLSGQQSAQNRAKRTSNLSG